MAKKLGANVCSIATKPEPLYLVFDDGNDELVASGVNINQIEDVVVDYIEENGFDQNDVNISVYAKTSIEVDVIRSTKVILTRK